MNKDEIIRMALEAGSMFELGEPHGDMVLVLERFAALVATAEREKEKERQRYDIHSCGPDCDRYICVAVRKAREEERNRTWTQEHWTEYERSIAAAEREACAKVCEAIASSGENTDNWTITRDKAFHDCAAAIRRRSEIDSIVQNERSARGNT